MARQLAGGHATLGDVLHALDHVGVGNLLAAQIDADLGVVLGNQRLELFQQVAAEVPGMRDRGGVDARPLEFRISPP